MKTYTLKCMKRIVLLFTLLSLSFVMAGELQTLHRVLAKPSTSTQTQQPEIQTKTPGVAVVPGALSPAINKVDHGITEIGIERTRCLTNCPAYTLIINADGSFRYKGEYAVEKMGEHTGQVSQGILNQVLAFINETGYMDWEDSYSSAFLDSATSYTLVTQNGTSKVIENYANSGPASLWAIEKLIDDLLETAIWDGE